MPNEETANRIEWDWDGLGLTLTRPDGSTLYLQGEEGAKVFDELEAAETDDAEQTILAVYDENVEVWDYPDEEEED